MALLGTSINPAASVIQSLNYWSNRRHSTNASQSIPLALSASAALAQLGSGYAGSGAVGLVGGQLAGQVLATSVLARLVWREDCAVVRTLSVPRSLVLAAY